MAVIFTIDSLRFLLTIPKSYIFLRYEAEFFASFSGRLRLTGYKIMKGASYAFAIGPERQ